MLNLKLIEISEYYRALSSDYLLNYSLSGSLSDYERYVKYENKFRRCENIRDCWNYRKTVNYRYYWLKIQAEILRPQIKLNWENI